MVRRQTELRPGKILLSHKDVSAAIARLSHQLKDAYSTNKSVIVLVLLNGAKRFADKLFNLIDEEKFELRYIRVKSYNGTGSSGDVEIIGTVGDVTGRDVLIVDDIYDSGATLSSIIQMLRQAGASHIRTCVMLRKQTKRKKDIQIDFNAAQIPDCFVVGYGLDYNGRYRELPFVAAVEKANS